MQPLRLLKMRQINKNSLKAKLNNSNQIETENLALKWETMPIKRKIY